MNAYKYYIKPFLLHPLNRNNRFKAVLNFLKWQLLIRHASKNDSYVVAQYIGGLKCLVKKRLSGMTGNLYSGLQEFEEMAFLLHFLRKDDIFFDIGANVGIYTLLASGIRNATSYCFEPIPETFYFLKCNVVINNLESKVVAFNMGVANENGFLNFSTDHDSMNHVVDKDYTGKIEKVKVITLDNEFTDKVNTYTMMKIDTEGFEDQILLGARKILENNYVKAILIEMNKPELIHTLLTKFGFNPYSYDAFKRKLTPVDYKTEFNVIYVRDLDFVYSRITSAESIKIKGTSI